MPILLELFLLHLQYCSTRPVSPGTFLGNRVRIACFWLRARLQMMRAVRFGLSIVHSRSARWRFELALDLKRLGVGRFEISVAVRSFEVLDLAEPVPGRSLELMSVVSRAKESLPIPTCP